MSDMPRTCASGAPRASRAQQFMPFAALRGYYDLVRERERVREPRHELTEEEARELDAVAASLRKGAMVEVVHYDADAYVTTTGVLTGIDPTLRTLTVVKRGIAFADVRSLRVVEG